MLDRPRPDANRVLCAAQMTLARDWGGLELHELNELWCEESVMEELKIRKKTKVNIENDRKASA